MFKSPKVLLAIAALVVSIAAPRSYGTDVPSLFPDYCAGDLEWGWFEPVSCDCPDDYVMNEGIFFSYERVYWNSLAAPRRALGNDRVNAVSTTLVTNDDGLFVGFDPAPAATAITNAVDVANPDSQFGWGNRYELGYVQDGAGWTIGILHNVNANDDETYGRLDSDVDLNGDGLFDATDNFQTFTGRVQVLFDVDPSLLVGFVDEANDGTIDDVDSDGVVGVGAPTDFDDLALFVPSFDHLEVSNRMQTDGVELMHTIRPSWGKNQKVLEFMAGVRYMRVSSEMRALGTGGFLADSDWLGAVENKMVGPQVGMKFTKQQGRFLIRGEGRFMAALNVRDASLEGIIGTLFQPSRINNSLYFNPTSFAKYDSDKEFSPFGEVRLEAVFQLSKRAGLKFGYTGMYASNITHGSSIVGYSLPELTLRSLDDVGTEHYFVNGVNFGIEVNR